MYDLTNKIALVTGANRGIGLEIARGMLLSGATVIFHVRNEKNILDSELENLKLSYPERIHFIFFDLRNLPSGQLLKQMLPTGINAIDILVNNAGIIHGELLQMTKDDDINEIFNVNLFAVIRLTKALIPYLRRSKTATVINISSINSFDQEVGNSLYGVAKLALNGLTKVLYKELSIYGIRVNAIAPGLVDTQMAANIEKKAFERALSHQIGHQPIQPQAIAKVVLFLASEDSSIINGEIIRCDGGRI